MKELAPSKAGVLVRRLVAIVLGLALVVAGLGMSVGIVLKPMGGLHVSLVLLPIGLPLCLVGWLVLVWGLFGWDEGNQGPTQPPDPT